MGATFVGNVTDDNSLQTLFEIFDIDQDGYLEIEDIARILLCQNQIAVVVTGNESNKQHIIYNKQQCLKQARRMVAQYDSEEFNDNKISYDEFKEMMKGKTENDMMIDHMQAPSISVQQMVTILKAQNEFDENAYNVTSHEPYKFHE